ncbi:uncharacterized protein M437DRAFT_74752 [Aureobasidium melanogenum CBS 110374]|uniref:F-box domain-containing protein n=1 Tax=Aureobasidium melanogenum (strain CBS 110374) TaxID=1043003 RepID=A0A074W0N3_AURM1|nr:uncharacterized protein M437DRAFT_74752 [Aureobasidium melanogenum CBS 110374]KEQ63502.1 hypothetical protein M437DRAFT_74752 [Aureobasidium melanogenum CBS 110374]
MDILFKLPAEISNLAVDLLDCKTLACLRLVCSEAHQIATPTFGRRYFHTLRPAFLPDCLNSLIKISENRDVSLVKQILRLHNLGSETRLLVAHSHCIQKQQHFIESSQHIKLIRQALTNFRDAGVSPALGIFDNKHSNASIPPLHKGWSADPYYKEFFEVEAWYRASGEVLSAVITAAKLCNYPLECITLDACVGMTIPMGTRETSRPVNHRVDHILANILSDAGLCNSKLSFRFDIMPQSDDCMTSRLDIDCQNRRLGFRSLRRSEVTNYARFKGLAGLGKLATIFNTNTFCEIDISRCEAEVYVLSSFLRAHSGSLKRLRLSRIVFCGSSLRHESQEMLSAADFLRMLKDELKHLEYLELEDFEGSDCDWRMLPISTVRIKSSGMQDFESTLDLWLQPQGTIGEQHG